MCEIPSNVILAKAFAERFDGFSIGSNDLTQLTLGVDRNSSELAELFDEQDDAVKWMIRSVIARRTRPAPRSGCAARRRATTPSSSSSLSNAAVNSMSVSPDSFIAVKRRVAATKSGMSTRRPAGRS